MTKPANKRKKQSSRRKANVKRHPNNRIVQPSRVDSLANVRMVQSRVHEFGLTPSEAAAAAYLFTEHGRMARRGLITADAERVCDKYVAIEEAWRQVSTAPRIAQMGDGPRGMPVEDFERAAKAQAAFAAVTALWDGAPAAGIAVRQVTIKGRPPVDKQQAAAFFVGVHMLARHFGMPLKQVCPTPARAASSA